MRDDLAKKDDAQLLANIYKIANLRLHGDVRFRFPKTWRSIRIENGIFEEAKKFNPPWKIADITHELALRGLQPIVGDDGETKINITITENTTPAQAQFFTTIMMEMHRSEVSITVSGEGIRIATFKKSGLFFIAKNGSIRSLNVLINRIKTFDIDIGFPKTSYDTIVNNVVEEFTTDKEAQDKLKAELKREEYQTAFDEYRKNPTNGFSLDKLHLSSQDLNDKIEILFSMIEATKALTYTLCQPATIDRMPMIYFTTNSTLFCEGGIVNTKLGLDGIEFLTVPPSTKLGLIDYFKRIGVPSAKIRSVVRVRITDPVLARTGLRKLEELIEKGKLGLIEKKEQQEKILSKNVTKLSDLIVKIGNNFPEITQVNTSLPEFTIELSDFNKAGEFGTVNAVELTFRSKPKKFSLLEKLCETNYQHIQFAYQEKANGTFIFRAAALLRYETFAADCADIMSRIDEMQKDIATITAPKKEDEEARKKAEDEAEKARALLLEEEDAEKGTPKKKKKKRKKKKKKEGCDPEPEIEEAAELKKLLQEKCGIIHRNLNIRHTAPEDDSFLSLTSDDLTVALEIYGVDLDLINIVEPRYIEIVNVEYDPLEQKLTIKTAKTADIGSQEGYKILQRYVERDIIDAPFALRKTHHPKVLVAETGGTGVESPAIVDTPPTSRARQKLEHFFTENESDLCSKLVLHTGELDYVIDSTEEKLSVIFCNVRPDLEIKRVKPFTINKGGNAAGESIVEITLTSRDINGRYGSMQRFLQTNILESRVTPAAPRKRKTKPKPPPKPPSPTTPSTPVTPPTLPVKKETKTISPSNASVEDAESVTKPPKAKERVAISPKKLHPLLFSKAQTKSEGHKTTTAVAKAVSPKTAPPPRRRQERQVLPTTIATFAGLEIYEEERILAKFNKEMSVFLDLRRANEGFNPDIMNTAPPILSEYINHLCANRTFLESSIHGSFLYSKAPKDLDMQIVIPDGFLTMTPNLMALGLPEELRKIAKIEVKEVGPRSDRFKVGKITLGNLCEISFVEHSRHIKNQSWISTKDAKYFCLNDRMFKNKPAFQIEVAKQCGYYDPTKEQPFIINHQTSNWPLRFIYSNPQHPILKEPEELFKMVEYYEHRTASHNQYQVRIEKEKEAKGETYEVNFKNIVEILDDNIALFLSKKPLPRSEERIFKTDILNIYQAIFEKNSTAEKTDNTVAKMAKERIAILKEEINLLEDFPALPAKPGAAVDALVASSMSPLPEARDRSRK